jgi:XTP/dITP diphosphohydrolase
LPLDLEPNTSNRNVNTLIIATRNSHKVGEIAAILGPQFKCVSLREFPDAPQVVEDAPTFAGNAIKKAVELAKWLSTTRKLELTGPCYVLADDSGLEVDALDGAPGVTSARFAALDSSAAGNSSDQENNAKLLRLLKDRAAHEWTARFRCVLALCPITPPEPRSASPVCYADELEVATETFEGACEGRITPNPSGHGGFGYDPLFVPNGHGESFAELGEAVKNVISHRAKALAKLKKRLLGLG